MGVDKKILVIPGDGIGQEVTAWGQKVLMTIAKNFKHTFTFEEGIMGHVAIEATGDPLPEETLLKARNSDAILFGAIGHAKYDNDPTLKVRPEQGLLKIRKELGLYANLRLSDCLMSCWRLPVSSPKYSGEQIFCSSGNLQEMYTLERKN